MADKISIEWQQHLPRSAPARLEAALPAVSTPPDAAPPHWRRAGEAAPPAPA